MENKRNEKGERWVTVFVPPEAVSKPYTSKKTGKEFVVVTLPKDAPAYAGWKMFHPATCARDTQTGAKSVAFPPNWTTIRLYSPAPKGQSGEQVELPVNQALDLFHDSFPTPDR